MRRIVVKGKEYEWKVGRYNILIRGDGVKYVARDRDLFPGVNHDRAWWAGLHITPADIREFILSKEAKSGKN